MLVNLKFEKSLWTIKTIKESSSLYLYNRPPLYLFGTSLKNAVDYMRSPFQARQLSDTVSTHLKEINIKGSVCLILRNPPCRAWQKLIHNCYIKIFVTSNMNWIIMFTILITAHFQSWFLIKVTCTFQIKKNK